jgi:hypothetical protein
MHATKIPTLNRATMPRCETCVWWSAYRCHRNPPIIVPTQDEVAGQWPFVRSDHYCGDHITHTEATP